MQPRVTTVGPIIAGSATKVALAQKPIAAGALALNGASGVFTTNNVCLSQSGTAATPLLLNGTTSNTSPGPIVTVNTTVAAYALIPDNSSFPGKGQAIYITSAGDDHLITFAVVGTDVNGGAQSETLTGTNAGVVASTNTYRKILSITPSGNTASTVLVGTFAPVTLDKARQLSFASSGTDTGISITISGGDWAGTPISETIAAAGSSGNPVTSVLNYLTINQVTVSGATAGTFSVGTNGVAASPWVQLDTWALGALNIQCDASGTVNYSVQSSNDDPNSYGNPVAAASMVWDANFAGIIGATTSVDAALSNPPAWMRVLLNSGSGSVQATIVQHGSVTY